MSDMSVIIRALNWLRENPDKHISGVLAKNASGRIVPPASEQAECFCALGRIAKEADIRELWTDYKTNEQVENEAPYEALEVYFAELGLQLESSDVFRVNDEINDGSPAHQKAEILDRLAEEVFNVKTTS